MAPRNVRNFWLELDVDGRSTRIAAGPVARDGGFDLVIKMRSAGDVVETVHVTGRADQDGALTLRVADPRRQWRQVLVVETER